LYSLIAPLQIVEKNSRYIKNYGIWMKYNSRSGTSNMYREYRDVSLTGAIDTMYQDMAGRHRTRAGAIQVIGTATVKDSECRREFPLPHRIMRAANKGVKATYLASRPQTHFQ
jgi:large subunit ribosomal protein L18Ae